MRWSEASSIDFSNPPPHLRELVEAPPSRLALYGVGDVRRQRYIDRFNLVYYCREARQPASEVEVLPLSEYQARRTVLHQILEEQNQSSPID